MSIIQPTVSVVLTCYNYSSYVGAALDSVLGQTFQDFEIILIDDGSTDGSDRVIEPFLTDPRIKYFRQSNSGQARAKNRGIEESSGEFIAFIDADDQWKKTKLAKQLLLFSDNHVGVVYSRASYIDQSDKSVDLVLSDKYLQPRSGKVTNWLYMNNFVPFSSAMVRKSCLGELGQFDEGLPMGIDWDLWLRISTRYSFDFVDESLLLYRVGHPGQMSKNETKRHECSDKIMRRFIEQYPDAVDRKVQKRAMLYTLLNRAEYYSVREPLHGMGLSFRAVRIAPFNARSYQGIFLALRHLLLQRKS